MSKFRKKPVVIEAFQMTEARRSDNSEWPAWLNQAWNMEHGEGALFIDSDDPTRQRLVIGTLEGVHRVSWDDFIIRGVKGELYACKPDIFALTYEAVLSTDLSEESLTTGSVLTVSGMKAATALELGAEVRRLGLAEGKVYG